MLKMAIRHRNNSLFYRSERGAEVGDLYMTLIATCVQNGENPFEYLTALLRFSAQAAARPGDWLPWTFRATLERKASAPEAEPVQDEGAPAIPPAEPSQQPVTATATPLAIVPDSIRHVRPEPDTVRVLSAKDAWEAALRAFADSSPHHESDAAPEGGGPPHGSSGGRKRRRARRAFPRIDRRP